MASQLRNVLIFGATGVIGEIIVDAILAAPPGSFDRVGVFTSQSTAESKPAVLDSLRSRGAETFVGNIENSDHVRNAYQGFDTVVSCLGRNMLLAQIQLLDLAESCSDVKRFYPSEFGTDIEYSSDSFKEKPHQAKLRVREWFKSSPRRLEYTYLVTGPYADLYLGKFNQDPRAGSFDVEKRQAVLLGDGRDPISLTTMNDVGKLLVASLAHPEASRNKALKVNSFTTTPNDILAEFERQMGALLDWRVQYTSLETLRLLEDNAYKDANPLAPIYTLRRIWTEGGTLYESRDNELIGAPQVDTLEVAVQRAISTAGEGFRSGEL